MLAGLEIVVVVFLQCIISVSYSIGQWTSICHFQ